MRRVLVGVAVVSTALLATVHSPAPAHSTPSTPIAVIGDSYTDGSAEGGNGPRSWPQLAWQMLAREGVEVDAGTFLQARLTAPAAKLLVIGPPWPTETPPPAVLRIRDALRDQAWGAGALFIDPIAEGWFVGRPDLIGGDGVHPNDAGHVYLAEKITPLIYDELSVRI